MGFIGTAGRRLKQLFAYRAGVDDLVDLVRRSVMARRAVDAREQVSIAAFVGHLDRLATPLDEYADPVHVTASAILTSDDGRRVLLHRHKRLGLWLQPGGHIDPGETPWDAARREAAEETGLEVTLVSDELVHVDVHPGPRGHTHLDLRYATTAPLVTPNPPEGESAVVEWFAWHRAIALADAGLEGVLRACQPGVCQVRPARAGDVTGIVRVYQRARAADARPSLDEGEVRSWVADEVIGHRDVWVADLDGTVTALLVLDLGATVGWIDQCWVDPSVRRRGLGDRLLTLAEERSAGGLQVWVAAADAGARGLLERHGFTAVETTDGRGNLDRLPDVRYQRIGRSAAG